MEAAQRQNDMRIVRDYSGLRMVAMEVQTAAESIIVCESLSIGSGGQLIFRLRTVPSAIARLIAFSSSVSPGKRFTGWSPNRVTVNQVSPQITPLSRDEVF